MTATPRLLDARAATRCAVRIQYDVLPPYGAVRTVAAPASQNRMDEAKENQVDVLRSLAALHPEAVVVSDGPEAVTETLAATESGADLIIGARLPQDHAGGRTGSPSVLLRQGSGYLPIDVRLHGTTTKDAKKSVLVSTLAAPVEIDARLGFTWKVDRLAEDAVPLAHFVRLLEALGLAAEEPRGAIIDRAMDVVWVDLGEASQKVSWSAIPVSWLDIYDHEFAFRRKVVAHAQAQIVAGTAERKVLPLAVKGCVTCPWETTCAVELVAQDHISLMPGFKTDWYDVFVDRAVTTRRELAALDPFTAEMVAGLTGPMLGKIEDAAADETLTELLPSREALVRNLADEDVRTAGELMARLDPATLAFRGTGPGGASFPAHIDVARAISAGGHHRRRGVNRLVLNEAAVEIDVDMESSASGHHYLWGALLAGLAIRTSTSGGGGGSEVGLVAEYLAFDSYSEMSDVAEAEVFVRFWAWLGEQRQKAKSLGGALRVYFWTPAELTAMRKIVRTEALPALPSKDELEASIKDEWVDLAKVWGDHVLTGHGRKLKPVAQSIGFTWDVDDPGGDFSMLQHQVAVNGTQEEREDAITWLRTYNGSDVRATYEVRRWLRANLELIPRIEDWKGA